MVVWAFLGATVATAANAQEAEKKPAHVVEAAFPDGRVIGSIAMPAGRTVQGPLYKTPPPPPPIEPEDLPLIDVPVPDERIDAPRTPVTSLQFVETSTDPQVPGTFVMARNSMLTPPSGFVSSVNEPSVGSQADGIFMTFNWYAAVSTDNGANFAYINPYTTFPNSPAAFSGGFCCDQRVAQDPSRDLVFWYLQYIVNGSSSTSTNGVRIAVAHGQAGLGTNTWQMHDFTPASFGIPAGKWLDYPNMQVSSNYLYFTSNVFDAATFSYYGAVIGRIPLAALDSNTPFTMNTFVVVGDYGSILPVNGAAGTMYFGARYSSNSIKVLTWPEASPAPTVATVSGLSTTTFGTYQCAGPDGLNPCGRSDTRMQAGWLTAGELGFMWSSAQDGGLHPYPYVRTLILNPATLAVLSQPDIFSTSSAFLYPHVAVNARGHLGGVVDNLGGSIYPMVRALIRDDLSPDVASGGWETMPVASSNAGTDFRWGDYNGAVAHEKYPNTWLGVGHVQRGGSVNAYSVPLNYWFMRERDVPGGQVVTISFDTPSTSVSESAGPVTLTVRLTTSDGLPTSSAASVLYATANGTAVSPEDYIFSSGSLSFPSGTASGTTLTLGVAVVPDTADEFDKTFTVSLFNAVGAALSQVLHTVTILDDDPPPSLTITDAALPEGNSGTRTADFRVLLSAPSRKTVSVHYATADGTATGDSAWTSSAPITINHVGAATPYPSSIVVPTLPGTIQKVTVTLAGFAHEFPGDVDVLLVGPAGQKVVLMSDAGGGFTVSNVTLVFDDGVAAALTGGTIVSGTYRPTNLDDVSPLGDNYPAPAPAGPHGTALSAFIGTSPTGTWRLFVFDDFGGLEGSISSWTLNFQIGGVSDYRGAAGTLTFPPGVTMMNLPITVYGDTVSEPNERFVVNLSAPVNATISDGVGEATITDDDLAACSTPSFGPVTGYAVGNSSRYVIPADFNHDGILDAVVSGTGIRILRGSVSGVFSNVSTVPGTGGPMAIGDFNGDSNVDLAVLSTSGGTVAVYLGVGDGTFGAPATFPTGASPQWIAVGDLNGDGSPDLAVTRAGTAEGVAILLGNGTGGFGAATFFPVPGLSPRVAVGDIDGDGRLDVVTTAGGSVTVGQVSILLGDGAGSLASPVSYSTRGFNPTGVVIVDLNGDDRADLAASNANSSSVGVLLGTGGGAFGIAVTFGAVGLPSSIGAADINGDGRPDLVVATTQSNDASILLGTGTGGFVGQARVPIGTAVDTVATGDFDGDGKIDLVTASSTASNDVAVVLNAATCDPRPLVNVSDVTVGEGHDGTVAANFTVSLSWTSARTVTATYATANGTATAPADYTALSGSLTFAPGETSKIVSVLVKGDRDAEGDETFSLNLTGADEGRIGDGQGIATIADDDVVNVVWTNLVGVAASGNSLTKTASTSAWDAGAVSVQTINSGGGFVEFTASETGTYRILGLSHGSASASESEIDFGLYLNNTQITIKENGVNQGFTVDAFHTGDRLRIAVEAGHVVYRKNGVLLFTSTQTPVYPLLVDTSLYSPGSTLTNAVITFDPRPQLSIGDAAVTEGHTGTANATFPVTLSAASAETVTVAYATADGTAVAPGDYAATSGTLTFAPGETSKSILVAVNGDTAEEGNETFTVSLGDASGGAGIADGQGVGTITDDDGPVVSNVMWTSLVGVSASGNSLTKTASTSAWDAGAVSIQNIPGGAGYVEITASETTTYRIFGLSNGNSSASDSDIDFGMYLYLNEIRIKEGGVGRLNGSSPTFGTFVPGDHLRVAVSNGVVRYSKNGAVLYTSAAAAVYPLLADTSLFTPGATLSNAVILFDPRPILSIGDATVTEGNVGTTTATFTVSLSASSPTAVTVDYATQDGTATAASGDYLAATGTLTFAPGETSKAVAVTVNGDTTDEPTETFFLNLSNPSNAVLGDGQGLGTITNDEGPIVSNVTWTSLVGVSATGNNLTKTAATSAWDAGAVSVQSLTGGDGYAELTVTDSSSYRVFGLSNGNTNASETDVDFGIYLYLGDIRIKEGGINRLNGSSPSFGSFASGDRLRVGVEGGVVKYYNNGLVFYTSTVTPTFPLLVDTSLYTPGAIITNAVIATDPRPRLSIGDVTVTEGNTGTVPATFTVTLSATSAATVTVNYATANGTAVAPGDYAPATGTLVFSPGETTKTFTVDVAGDTLEESAETFFINLTSPSSGALIGDGQGVGNILDNDSPPVVNIVWTSLVGVSATGNSLAKTATTSAFDAGAVSTQSLAGGNGYAEFTVTETNTYRVFGLSNGNSNATESDVDFGIYVYLSEVRIKEGGVNRLNGASPSFGTIVSGDRLRVGVDGGVVKYYKNGVLFYTSTGTPVFPLLIDTSFYTPGSTVTNAVILTDPRPLLSINDATVTESNGATVPATFTVTLSAAADTTVTVDYATANGTAAEPGDYTLSTGTLTFNPGETTKTITIDVAGDLLQESTETFTVNLSNASSNALIGDGQGVGSILDNDSPPVENVVWTSLVGASATGNNLTKTASTSAWDAGAVSTRALGPGDGYVDLTASETTTYRMLGLSNGNGNATDTDIDFALYLYGEGTVRIKEGGVSRMNGSSPTFATYVPGDHLRVSVEGGVVKYRKNGALLYTSTLVPVSPLLVDTSLWSPGATLNGVVISGNLQ
jgi:subtilisin-like proprotein convertase family protein